MRIVYTSDLHLPNSPWNPKALKLMVTRATELRPDILVLVGDMGNGPRDVDRALASFASLPARKLFVPGNHDVWLFPDLAASDSGALYRELLPRLCRRHGFHPLWVEPLVVGTVAFVGSLGWYDRSFCDPQLGAPHQAYRRGEWRGVEWMDRRYVRWVRPGRQGEGMADEEVASQMARELDDQIASVKGKARTVVAVVHTCPWEEVLPRSDPPDFYDGFMGSRLLGRVLEKHPEVRLCLGGHKHVGGDWKVGRCVLHRRVLGTVGSEQEVEKKAGQALGILDL